MEMAHNLTLPLFPTDRHLKSNEHFEATHFTSKRKRMKKGLASWNSKGEDAASTRRIIPHGLLSIFFTDSRARSKPTGVEIIHSGESLPQSFDKMRYKIGRIGGRRGMRGQGQRAGEQMVTKFELPDMFGVGMWVGIRILWRTRFGQWDLHCLNCV